MVESLIKDLKRVSKGEFKAKKQSATLKELVCFKPDKPIFSEIEFDMLFFI